MIHPNHSANAYKCQYKNSRPNKPPHKLGKEENLEGASTCPIESHDVTDAHQVKAQASHGNGHVEEWDKSVY